MRAATRRSERLNGRIRGFATDRRLSEQVRAAMYCAPMTTDQQEEERKRREAIQTQFQSALDEILKFKVQELCRFNLPSELAFGDWD